MKRGDFVRARYGNGAPERLVLVAGSVVMKCTGTTPVVHDEESGRPVMVHDWGQVVVREATPESVAAAEELLSSAPYRGLLLTLAYGDI